jgi:hypothetical protein
VGPEEQRAEAFQNFLRIHHDAGAWENELLKDPVTCQDSGPDLLTPLQVIEVDSPNLLMASPRQIWKSTDGGGSVDGREPLRPEPDLRRGARLKPNLDAEQEEDRRAVR